MQVAMAVPTDFQEGSKRNDNSATKILAFFKKLSRLCAGSTLLALTLSAASLWSQKTAQVQIDLKTEVAVVPAAGYGMHTSVYDNNFTPADLTEKLKTAGVTALRFPGGSYSDYYHWKTHSRNGRHDIYINSNDTFDNFMTKDVLPAGAQAVITVNYGSNAAGTGGGDPAEAADWVRYANIEKGWNIHYWEIGNEIGGNGFFGTEWEYDLHAPNPKGPNRKGNPALSQSRLRQEFAGVHSRDEGGRSVDQDWRGRGYARQPPRKRQRGGAEGSEGQDRFRDCPLVSEGQLDGSDGDRGYQAAGGGAARSDCQVLRSGA